MVVKERTTHTVSSHAGYLNKDTYSNFIRLNLGFHKERVKYIYDTIHADLNNIMDLAEESCDSSITILCFEEKVSEIKALLGQLYIGYVEDSAEKMDFLDDMDNAEEEEE